MRKILFAVLFTIFSSSIFAVDKWHTMYDGFWKVGEKTLITDDRINARNNPYISADVVFQLNKGDVVKVEEITANYYFADEAYTRWLKISCPKGTGYVVGRWSTACFAELDFNNNGKPEYFCYGVYGEINDDTENKTTYFKDEFFILNDDGRIAKFKDLTWISKTHGEFKKPNLSIVKKDTGYSFDGYPVALVRSTSKYNETVYCEAALYALSSWRGKTIIDDVIDIASSSCRSGKSGYSFADYEFKYKTYNVFEDKWTNNAGHPNFNSSDFQEIRRWGNGLKDDPNEKSEIILHQNK